MIGFIPRAMRKHINPFEFGKFCELIYYREGSFPRTQDCP